MSNELAKRPNQALAAANPQMGELWGHAELLAESDIVPAAYKDKPANCLIAIELAIRMGSSPMLIMQSLDLIHGKPAWKAAFLIATVNVCGRFSPLRYRYTGERGKKSWGCIAVATELATGEILEGTEITIEMADAEGWSTKNGSKWRTMPQQMLAYRAASFWTRLYCPEVSMGLHTTDEREEIETVGVTIREADTARESAIKALRSSNPTVIAAPQTATVAPSSAPENEPPLPRGDVEDALQRMRDCPMSELSHLVAELRREFSWNDAEKSRMNEVFAARRRPQRPAPAAEPDPETDGR